MIPTHVVVKLDEEDQYKNIKIGEVCFVKPNSASKHVDEEGPTVEVEFFRPDVDVCSPYYMYLTQLEEIKTKGEVEGWAVVNSDGEFYSVEGYVEPKLVAGFTLLDDKDYIQEALLDPARKINKNAGWRLAKFKLQYYEVTDYVD